MHVGDHNNHMDASNDNQTGSDHLQQISQTVSLKDQILIEYTKKKKKNLISTVSVNIVKK